MEFQDIRCEIADGIARITLNKPEKLNALSWNSWAEIEQALAAMATDDAVKVVLFTGEGRGFSSGTDLTHEGGNTVERPLTGRAGMMRSRMLAPAQIYQFPKPTIAAVNGVCVGAGFSLALACDIRLASEAARFSAIFVKRAISPDTGTSWLLPRIVGMEEALKMLYTGRLVPADEAKAIGLVSEVLPAAALMERANGLAAEIAAGPSVAVEIAKRLAHEAMERDIDSHVELEAFMQGYTRDTEDVIEGRRAFVEKREPVFKGR